jgi:hypothetical protein
MFSTLFCANQCFVDVNALLAAILHNLYVFMLSDAFGAKKCRGSAEEVPRSAEEVPRKCRGVPRKHIKINKTLIRAKKC